MRLPPWDWCERPRSAARPRGARGYPAGPGKSAGADPSRAVLLRLGLANVGYTQAGYLSLLIACQAGRQLSAARPTRRWYSQSWPRPER